MSASEEDEEIEKFREMFACIDADGSGKIDVTELSIGLRDKGMNRRRASIIKMIDNVDTDNDQELDFDEFLNLVQSEKLASLFSSEEKQELERQQSTVGLQNIYGQTPTPTETEECVKTGLGQLQAEIDAIGDDEKKGFNQALEKCPHLIDDDFLLMFLRTEVFHAGVSSICLRYVCQVFSYCDCVGCLSLHFFFISIKFTYKARCQASYEILEKSY